MALRLNLYSHLRCHSKNVNILSLYNPSLHPALNAVRFFGLSKFHHSKENLLTLRDERKGFIQDVFPLGAASDIAEWLKGGSRTMYAGFDPTADSLHIGNLLVIMAMLHAQRAGHKVIALIGDATVKIGDPSGKTTERPSLDDTVVNNNVLAMTENLERIFQNHQDIVLSEKQQNLFISSADLLPVQIVSNNYNGKQFGIKKI